MSFKKFNLSKNSIDFINRNGFKKPTAIQDKVIPLLLQGKNLIALAPTGTGKSHAFLIPLMEIIDAENPVLQVVITAPTRELALQLWQQAKLLSAVNPKLKIVLASGGSDNQRLLNQLNNKCQLLIGTPGRIADLVVNQQAIRVDKVKTLIIDEADMTWEYGFLGDVDQVAGRMPSSLQIAVFAATLPKQLQPFIKKYISNAQVIDLSDREKPDIEYRLVDCKHRSYDEELLNVLGGINPFICLIFTNTRKEASETAKTLRSNGYSILELHGDLPARQRRQALKRLQSQQHSYIVATDLAARGLDIESVTHVITLGFPKELAFFIHRAGRTGRIGRSGIVIALYKKQDEAAIATLKKQGIAFSYQVYRNNQWRIQKRKIRQAPDDPWAKEIARISNRKETTVKPGYKKKRKEEIEKIKKQKRREKIQASINELKKEKNKARQRAKRVSSQG